MMRCDFRRVDHGLVRAEHGAAFLADGLLEIGHDLGAIRAVLEARFGALQVGAQLVVARLLRAGTRCH